MRVWQTPFPPTVKRPRYAQFLFILRSMITMPTSFIHLLIASAAEFTEFVVCIIVGGVVVVVVLTFVFFSRGKFEPDVDYVPG